MKRIIAILIIGALAFTTAVPPAHCLAPAGTAEARAGVTPTSTHAGTGTRDSTHDAQGVIEQERAARVAELENSLSAARSETKVINSFSQRQQLLKDICAGVVTIGYFLTAAVVVVEILAAGLIFFVCTVIGAAPPIPLAINPTWWWIPPVAWLSFLLLLSKLDTTNSHQRLSYLRNHIQSLLDQIRSFKPEYEAEVKGADDTASQAAQPAARETQQQNRASATPMPASGIGVFDTDTPAYELDPQTIDDLELFDPDIGYYHKLNYTRTFIGAQRLTYLLLHPYLDADTIRRRQQATLEFVSNRELRRAIYEELRNPHIPRADNMKALAHSFFRPHYFSSYYSALLTLFAAAIISGTACLLYFPPAIPFIILLTIPRIMHIVETYADERRVIAEWQRIFRLSKRMRSLSEQSNSTLLRDIGQEIGKLLDGDLHAVAARPRLWNLHTAYQHNISALERLTALCADAEVLCALAESAVQERGYYCAPEILDPVDGPRIRLTAVDANHPGIAHEESVANPISMGPGRTLCLITAPNRTGKSVFLKNAALVTLGAQIGALVRARSVALTPMRIKTHLRMEDRLAAGKSLFDALTDRLAETFEMVVDDPYTLVVLDEVTEGTNPPDALAIEKAALTFLAGSGALAMAATHRLSMTGLADRIPGVFNMHFAEDDDGNPDFLIMQGPASATNAIEIAREKFHPDVVRILDEVLAAH